MYHLNFAFQYPDWSVRWYFLVERDRVRRTRDDRYSPSRSRSVSRSVSPRYERNYRSKQKSPRRSRSISRSPSPREKRNYRSPIGNGQSPNDERDHEPSMSLSPDGKLRSPRNYRSRSYRYVWRISCLNDILLNLVEVIYSKYGHVLFLGISGKWSVSRVSSWDHVC